MRAKTKIYHIDCFRCTACERQLIPGDEFALRDGGSLFCKEDHDHLGKSSQPSSIEHNNNNAMLNNNNTISSQNQTSLGNNNHSSEMGSMSGKMQTHFDFYYKTAKTKRASKFLPSESFFIANIPFIHNVDKVVYLKDAHDKTTRKKTVAHDITQEMPLNLHF